MRVRGGLIKIVILVARIYKEVLFMVRVAL